MTVNSTGFNVGTLMGSLSSSSSPFDGIYSNLGQSKMIARGSYLGLLKNYYSKYDKDGELKSGNSTSADDTKTSNAVKSKAEDLSKAVDSLSNSKLYDKVKVKDKDGNEKEDYDYDDLYKRVSAFVDAYNSALDSSADSNTRGVLQAAASMTRNTSANASTLAKVGIAVGSNNKLSVDEKLFKTGDMSALKSLFSGAGSFGYQTKLQASMIKSYEDMESSKTATYGANGKYSNNYATSFNDFI